MNIDCPYTEANFTISTLIFYFTYVLTDSHSLVRYKLSDRQKTILSVIITDYGRLVGGHQPSEGTYYEVYIWCHQPGHSINLTEVVKEINLGNTFTCPTLYCPTNAHNVKKRRVIKTF